jgi:hypothetical protein
MHLFDGDAPFRKVHLLPVSEASYREVNRSLVVAGAIDVAAKMSIERHEVGVP